MRDDARRRCRPRMERRETSDGGGRSWRGFWAGFRPFERRGGDGLFRGRMKICILAVCLMWATSLKVAVFVSSFFIEVPPFELIVKSCKTAYGVSRDEKRRYGDCVDMQLDGCESDLMGTAHREARRVNASASRNERTVERAKEVQSDCSSAYSSLRYSLETWASGGGSVPLRDEDCTSEERADLTSMVGDISSVRSEAFSLSSEYSDLSQGTVRRLADYARARASYDAEYIDNHTQFARERLYRYARSIDVPLLDLTDIFDRISSDVDDLVSCVSPRNARHGSCPSFEGARELLAGIREQVDARFEVYIDELHAFRAAVGRYRDNVHDAYKISKRFYEETKRVVDKYLLSAFFGGDWYGVPVSSFLPTDVQFPTSDLTFDDLPTLDSVWESVSPMFDAFNKKMTFVVSHAAQEARALKDSVESSIMNNMPDLTPEDYNPPAYVGSSESVTSAADERLVHSQMSKSFVERSAVALDAFSELTKSYSTDDSTVQQEGSFFNVSAVRDKLFNIDISFESLSSPGIDFDLWFLQFSSLSDVMFLLDFAFRTYCTVRLIARYWSVGALNMPHVDLRTKRERTNPFRMSYMKLIAFIATNPLVGAFLCVLFGAWLVAIAYSIYSPLYNEYLSGCVPHAGNGTFVTNNLFSVAFNYAYQDGSGDLVAGLESFDAERGRICTSLFTSSARRQNDDSSVFSTLVHAHDKYTENMDVLKRCLDAGTIDAEFEEACCGLEGYRECTGESGENRACPLNEFMSPAIPFPPPGTYLAEESCTVDMNGEGWEILDAVFDCRKLPSCDVTCKGPHKEKVRAVTNECGCTTEWYMHSVLLQVVVSLAIYASFNVSRISLLEGLARILWKKLHPDMFTVLLTCRGDGEVARQKSGREADEGDECSFGQEDAHSMGAGTKEEIQARVERNMKMFQVSGIAMIILALCVNVPWIYILVVTTNSTKPEWLG